jgi:hypothetical protein
MGLLNRFLRRRYDDPLLGSLTGTWGGWRGQIVLGSGLAVPLVLAANVVHSATPGERRLQLARELTVRYAELVPAVERALFEHYAPYGEAIAAGDEPPHPRVPLLTHPEQVRPFVSTVRVLIAPIGHVETVEIAYRAAWDDEHTLGARFQDWQLVELNGSIRA